MPNLFDLILALPRQSRIALATWIVRTLRLSPKEQAEILGVSTATVYNRRRNA